MYVVKKIKLRPESKFERNILSSISHPNIIRYFWSWTETVTNKISMAMTHNPESVNVELEDVFETVNQSPKRSGNDSEPQTKLYRIPGRLLLTSAVN